MREQRNIAKTPLTYNYFLRFSIKIFPDFWPQATPYLAAGQQPHPLAAGQAPLIGRRPQRIAEFFACGKTGLSHRNHRNHRNPRKDDRVTAQSPNRQGYKERIKRQTLSISI